MKIQLLMTIVLIVSSLMTVSQRISAHEVNQLWWGEPNLEQVYNDAFIPDQDNSTDKAFPPSSSLDYSNVIFSFVAQTADGFCATSSLANSINPRAPPFLTI